MHAKSKVKLNMGKISQLTKASVTALEQTAEAVHTDLVQSQTMPRMDGTLQNTQTFVDYSYAKKGSVSIVFNTPYARRLYYHPEYNFHKDKWEETIKHRDGRVEHKTHEGNPNAGGKWAEPYMKGGKKQNFAPRVYKAKYRQLGRL